MTLNTEEPGDAITAEFLALCARQLHVAVTDSVVSMDKLVASVLTINRSAESLDRQIENEDGAMGPTRITLGTLRDTALEASMQLQSADRLHQRLENVSSCLSQLSILMSAISGNVTGDTWRDFLKEARGNYTMESERQMFDAVFGDLVAIDTDEDESGDPVLF